MSDEINFVDIMALSKIGSDAVVEKFGGMINSSFFDASNILGALKIKGLIDFTTSFPGQSAITVTELGKQTMKEAGDKTKEPFDPLDFALISQLSGGKRSLSDLGGAVNIRPRDMAMHLYKLMQMQYLTSAFRNGVLDIALTEKGFLQVKAGMPQQQQQQPQQAGAPGQQTTPAGFQPIPVSQPQPGVQEQAQAAQAKQPDQLNEVEKLIAESRKKRSMKKLTIAIVIVVIIILIAVLSKYKLI